MQYPSSHFLSTYPFTYNIYTHTSWWSTLEMTTVCVCVYMYKNILLVRNEMRVCVCRGEGASSSLRLVKHWSQYLSVP